MIQSDLPGQAGRLHVAARCGDRVAYLWREPAALGGWHGPHPVIAVELDDRRLPFAGAAGNVVLIRSHSGRERRNWELMAPAAAGGGVLHFWLDNDAAFPLKADWRIAPRLLSTLGPVDAFALIESELARETYALEVVVRLANRLYFAWRNVALQWSAPAEILLGGHPLLEASGTLTLIQSRFGQQQRNFELVCPRSTGGLFHLWRDNDSADPVQWRWHRSASVMDPRRMYVAASLIQSRFGPAPGNLEVVARTDRAELMHFWRETATMQWHGPARLH